MSENVIENLLVMQTNDGKWRGVSDTVPLPRDPFIADSPLHIAAQLAAHLGSLPSGGRLVRLTVIR